MGLRSDTALPNEGLWLLSLTFKLLSTCLESLPAQVSNGNKRARRLPPSEPSPNRHALSDSQSWLLSRRRL